ncbi:ABC transporter ATP-binding protein [Lactonifactor longoviformis]|uniref:ABC transporter ATP-binding protein n=1 Tax=Lactonifactor TaxID=420345 RepID=UPI0012AFD59D|nr:MULTISPECIES: ABC transporter ATP-binding protein [Lactonifactor]MCB5711839.1 ABC transporter ATP-binding protein [Lactonifactor longoviformis]MCB5715806.1 ABC transporter ATP-binding protein [Lactonifactor longoviformis]MCQ4671160.1 ABC transporter ATP-binding protein [Lactonifactor longoviformis]MSA00928.1 ATP-binding cassette domain-containing protein [Lactonifactor sp. BIOML-A5]MSA07722.1 ATP-binding cassette domain-containing protein [Lactonifactor sp. BIOML-A4]
MKKVLLQGRKVSKVFAQGSAKNKVLDHVDVDIYDKDFTVIMGSSGAGKSTLLYVLSGMDAVTDGTVTYKEREISRLKEKEMAKIRAEEFGFVFQQTHLVSNLTLFENIVVAGYVSKKGSAGEIQDRAERMVSQMGIEKAKNRLPCEVSGGEAQRAAIARAMIGSPGLLFADEPTGALNRSHTEEVLNLLSAINDSGQSILMVTHDLKAALRGNRILYLEDGKIVDELKLPPYQEAQERERENKLQNWLYGLQW